MAINLVLTQQYGVSVLVPLECNFEAFFLSSRPILAAIGQQGP